MIHDRIGFRNGIVVAPTASVCMASTVVVDAAGACVVVVVSF